ncbi:hypothetical protein [Leptolyngbya sp. FACHB-711]|uniref:hypothetical protein n=1 Tax=unclassified Leptolyngbya TaxID=2650499 RepID=UPI001686B956|nr:hypothetical protein [Leptolyngbya sp. FACHB-711]MBD1852014.1 hypothetical protein [Cyanobacteria bacterium FACHB-502]MBD2026300.1 hypothetical protein [Leptolyngbya sp. FACHB-711]
MVFLAAELFSAGNLETLKLLLPLAGSLLGVLLTGAIGLATYSWQENTKRKSELVERRQKLYEDLNSALFGLILAKAIEDRRRILAEIEKGWLFASDEVLAALFKYMETYDRHWTTASGDIQKLIREDETVRRDIEQGMAEIFLAMRRDLRDTRLSDAMAKNYMHFYNCGMLSQESDAL